MRFPDTFYGNTTDRNRARPLDITAGTEVRGIDIQLTPAKGFTIRGRVIDRGTGQPISINPADVGLMPDGDIIAPSMRFSFPIRDGMFRFEDVMPGNYILSTAAYPGPTQVNGPQPRRDLRGMLTLTVANADLTVDLLASTGTAFSGTVRFEGEAPPNAEAAIALESRARALISGPDRVSATVANGNSFEIAGLHPTPYFFNVSATPSPAYIKSIDGEPVNPSRPLLLDFNNNQRAEIVLSTHTASVSGTLLGAGLVAIWPTPMEPWSPFAIRSVRPKPDGKFTVEGLAPGKYFAAAWEFQAELEALIFDPAFLRQFEVTTLELTEDARATVELNLIPRQAIDEALEKLP